eukprot:8465987-Alexandrium_andersonii.AAC.1
MVVVCPGEITVLYCLAQLQGHLSVGAEFGVEAFMRGPAGELVHSPGDVVLGMAWNLEAVPALEGAGAEVDVQVPRVVAAGPPRWHA